MVILFCIVLFFGNWCVLYYCSWPGWSSFSYNLTDCVCESECQQSWLAVVEILRIQSSWVRGVPFSSALKSFNSAQLTQAQGFGILYGAWWLLYYCRYRTRNKSKPLAFLLIYYTYGRFLCTSARESEIKVCMQQAKRVVCDVEWVRYVWKCWILRYYCNRDFFRGIYCNWKYARIVARLVPSIDPRDRVLGKL